MWRLQSSGSRRAPEVTPATAETGTGDIFAERVAKLSRAQLDCLRLVHQHLSSKEIAAQLGISPHTVDQRIRQALAILKLERRTQAARIIARYPESNTDAYQRLIDQSPYIPAGQRAVHEQGAAGTQIRQAGRAGEIGSAGLLPEQKPASFWSSLQPPFATRRSPSNLMSAGQRLLWIAAIAMAAAFCAGMYLAGLESLARLMRH